MLLSKILNATEIFWVYLSEIEIIEEPNEEKTLWLKFEYALYKEIFWYILHIKYKEYSVCMYV